MIWQDARRNYGEERFRAVGDSEGDILHVVFTWRGGRGEDYLGAASQSKGN
jgi:uncharacterized DUF497 family protein